MTAILPLLQHSPLFASLEDGLLAEVATLGRHRRVAAGAVLFLRGAPGDGLYGIVRGRETWPFASHSRSWPCLPAFPGSR
jgi:hypothetical protein